MLYIIFNYLTWRFAIYQLFGEILGGTTIYSNAGTFRNFWRKIYTLTIEYAIKNSPKQIYLDEKGNPVREMGKDGDQGESSKSQRTTRVSSRSAAASLPRSLCPEMCMICKKKNLKLKHNRQLQLKTGRLLLQEMIIAISEAYLIANLFQKHKKCYLDYTRIAIKILQQLKVKVTTLV